MEFIQALKECFENPNKIYERDTINGKVQMIYDGYEFLFKETTEKEFLKSSITCYDFKSDWKLILQKITYEDALKLWLTENKTIKCIVPDTYINEYLNKEYIIKSETKDFPHVKTLLQHGEWYMLD